MSSNFWADTFWGFLIPAPQVTNGVKVSEGWPAPWKPRNKTSRVIDKNKRNYTYSFFKIILKNWPICISTSSHHTPKCVQLCIVLSFKIFPKHVRASTTDRQKQNKKNVCWSTGWKNNKNINEKTWRRCGQSSVMQDKQSVKARSVLERTEKSLDEFLPGNSGWCNQKPLTEWSQLTRILHCDVGTQTSSLPCFVLCAHTVFALGISQKGQGHLG